MRTIIWVMLAITLAGCASGGISIVDVTNDGRFQGGYRAGQVWRLKTDAYLVQWGDGGLELWTPSETAGHPEAIHVPARSTLHIDRLGYLFNPEHPPVAGGTTTMIWGYGTLTAPDGRSWQVTVLPAVQGGKAVPGTSLVVYPADEGLLDAAPPREGRK
jgi:hypothetical protein